MRQVPQHPKYLLIGGGRLSRHLSHYFNLLNVTFASWNRNDHSTASLVQSIKDCDVVLLCISDDQLTPFYEQFKEEKTTFVHFSGAFQHLEIHGFHPLMSFGRELYSLERYQEIHFIGIDPIDVFKKIFPQFKNSYSPLPVHKKALYHSLCVLSGNGTTLLWDLVEQEFRKMGLPPEALKPYLEQVTNNIISKQEGRWTGPWYRQDTKTVEANKEALNDQCLLPLYSELEKLSRNTGHFNEKHL
jgi:hypothetical protein